MSSTWEPIGSRVQLKAVRKERRLSQHQVAERAGISQSYYCELEKGTRPLNEKTLRSICEALNVEPSQMFHGDFFGHRLANTDRPVGTAGQPPTAPPGGGFSPARGRGLPSEQNGDAMAVIRIAEALERMSPPPMAAPEFGAADAFVWHTRPDRIQPVGKVNRVALPLLVGIDRSRDTLLANTRQFAKGLPANNALLWGARGMGKSSLVKAIHAEVVAEGHALKIVEVQREDLPSIGRLLSYLRGASERFLLFCDDLSFSHDDEHYKSLKAVLDGGVEGRPENVVLYATSNRRHLMPRDMIENERSTAISPSEATEEKVSLSDRFGLWLGFHPCSQDEYLAMIRGYCAAFGIDIDDAALRAEAIEWQATRGARSGRVAWQYVTDLAGRRGVGLP